MCLIHIAIATSLSTRPAAWASQVASSSTYSTIKTLVAPSFAFLANQLHQVDVIDDAVASNLSSLSPVPALTTSMAGVHESPKHLIRTCDS